MNRWVIVALVALSVMSGEAESRVPYYAVNHDFVWTEEKEWPSLIQAIKDSGSQAVRLPMRWPVAEPERGRWDWTRMDKAVSALRAAKITILANYLGTPPWASGIDPAAVKGFPDCYMPKDWADWDEFVRKSVTRYRKDIGYWEIWNEENGVDFYKPLPNASRYVEMLKRSHAIIKNIDPGATVVLGGLQMNGIIPNPWLTVKTPDFLQAIYDAGGGPYFDVVNIHPYVLATPNEGPAYCAKLVRATVDVMKKNGDRRKPLWITETGVAAEGGVTEEMQYEHLKGIYTELGKIEQVKAIYWFTLRDYPSAICGGENAMGLLALDHRRKPAFDAFRQTITKARAGK